MRGEVKLRQGSEAKCRAFLAVLTVIIIIVVGGLFIFSSTSEEEKAPDFTLKTLEDENFTLSQLQGKKVLLIFWKVDCPSCKYELKGIQDLAEELESRADIEIVAVCPHGKRLAKTALREILGGPPKFTVLCSGAKVFELYGIVYTPTNILIAPNGKIYKRFVGPRPVSFLKAQLENM